MLKLYAIIHIQITESNGHRRKHMYIITSVKTLHKKNKNKINTNTFYNKKDNKNLKNGLNHYFVLIL